MNLVLECVLKCFFVGGWVLPELQQICGVQFGSGTNPGGHVFFVWMAPWSVKQHPPPTFQVVCE